MAYMKQWIILLVTLAVFLWGTYDANATSGQAIELACPVCGANVNSVSIFSTNSAGGQDRDLLTWARGAQVLVLVPTTCLNCRYSGYPEDFKKHVSDELKGKILDGKSIVVPEHKAINPDDKTRLAQTGGFESKKTVYPAWVRHDLIAQTMALKGEDDIVIAKQYLATAWAVRIEENPFDCLAVEIQGQDEEWVKGLLPNRKKLKDPQANMALEEIKSAEAMLKDIPTYPKERQRIAAIVIAWFLRQHGEDEALLKAMPIIKSRFMPEEWIQLERDVADSIKLERKYQEVTCALMEKILADDKQEAESEDRAAMTYLIAEISRRIGDYKKAREFFDKACALKEAPEWVTRYASEQKALIPESSK